MYSEQSHSIGWPLTVNESEHNKELYLFLGAMPCEAKGSLTFPKSPHKEKGITS